MSCETYTPSIWASIGKWFRDQREYGRQMRMIHAKHRENEAKCKTRLYHMIQDEMQLIGQMAEDGKITPEGAALLSELGQVLGTQDIVWGKRYSLLEQYTLARSVRLRLEEMS